MVIDSILIPPVGCTAAATLAVVTAMAVGLIVVINHGMCWKMLYKARSIQKKTNIPCGHPNWW
jgi:hypothetical protein